MFVFWTINGKLYQFNRNWWIRHEISLSREHVGPKISQKSSPGLSKVVCQSVIKHSVVVFYTLNNILDFVYRKCTKRSAYVIDLGVRRSYQLTSLVWSHLYLPIRDWSVLRKNRASLRHVKPIKIILQKGKLTLKTNTRCVVFFFCYPQNHICGLFTEVKGLSAVENFVRCNPSHWKKFSSNRAVGTRNTRGQSPPLQPRFLQEPSPSETLGVLLVLPYFQIVLRSC